MLKFLRFRGTEEMMPESLMEWIAILAIVAVFGFAWSLLYRYGTLHIAPPWRLIQVLGRRGRTLADVRETERTVATFRCNICNNVEACDKWREQGSNTLAYRNFCPNAELIDQVTSPPAR
jgi:hypothetical protein